MSESASKAVFLSYASQDAEAARRMCEALRSGGVEVWFDADGGLEHGDEWDAKIRRQIKECVLFIPVISANTQARHEGYFRIEWDLAAERARGIASGVPFILPVVIDDTREPDALVPDRFRAVQWTRLAGGVVPPEVQARFLKLWSHRTGVLKHAELEAGRPRPAQRDEGVASPVQSGVGRRVPAAAWAIAAIVSLAVGGYFWLKRPTESAPIPAQNAGAGARPPTAGNVAMMSPELASVRARIIPDRWTREDFEVLKATLDRLIQSNPEEADAWALRSIIASLQVIRTFDFGTKILVVGNADAERAVHIAPDSPLAELALGLHHVAMMTRGGDPHAPRPHIERAVAGLSRDALTRYAETAYYGWSLRIDDANQACREWLAAEPTASFPRWVLGWHAFTRRQPAEAEQWATEGAKYGDSVTAVRSHSTLFEVNFYLRADLAAAHAALDRVPPAAMANHRIVYVRWFLALAERQWDEAIRNLARVPDTVLFDRSFTGPKALLTGIAHAKAGRAAPAEAQFAEAERVLRELLASDSGNEQLHAALALTLAYVGRGAEARAELAAIEPLLRGRPPYIYSAHIQAQIAETYAVLDDAAGMVPWLRPLFGVPSSVPYTPASFRLDPRFESMAKDPRVEALLAEFSLPDPAKPTSAVATPDPKSVAVLAFANLSDDKGNEYFSDGISEELLTVLQKIPGLHVAARTSAFSFKGKTATVQEIGGKLNVAHLVEGSVQKSGNRVKITARLSRAATGEELWSKSFGPIELTDVFAMQSELAQAIVGELRGRFTGEAAAAAQAEVAAQVQSAIKGGTKNSAAHQHYLQGRFFATQFSRENIDRAIGRFQQAVELDSNFALAWAALSREFTLQGSYGVGVRTLPEIFGDARRAAERALVLEPSLAEGHAAMGEVLLRYDLNWKGAAVAINRGLELAPSDATIIGSAATMASVFGRHDRVIDLARQAVALDPLNSQVHYVLADLLFDAGKISEAEAEAEYRRQLEINPGTLYAYSNLAVALLREGRIDEAGAVVVKEPEELARNVALSVVRWAQGRTAEADAALQVLMAHGEIVAYQVAQAYAQRRDFDRTFTWLDRARETHDSGLSHARADVWFAPMHADPRWPKFLKTVGLADEQLK